ncbi:hypothetical protein EVJ58_g4568 [Rhodofomes roseus]|uniref:PB1 domain-containing protein n=1 Tax=Rhodofomes roseus TaxID=34475 RepID=A0A4Y9YG62_9APHY|nr:hypothetical protein EVJ58_g4568 [Rhodofomes roseus]
MSTPQFHIKLSQPHGFTRAVLFTAPPTWDDLTSRIKSFFDIPEDRVALAYVDADGDEVTLNSQHELHELFTALRCDTDSTTLKFAVRDMRDLRKASFSEDTHHVMSAPDVTGEHDGEPQVEPTIAAEATAGEHAPPHTDDPSLPGRPAFSMPSRGMCSPRGRGGRRGGRGGGRGGFGGPLRGHHIGHPSPRSRPGIPPTDFPFPMFPGPPAHGRGAFVSRGAPPSPMSHEMFRAHSAPPELHTNDPEAEDVFTPEWFTGFHHHGPPRDGPRSPRSRSPTPGDTARSGRRPRPHHHHHQHQRGGPRHFGRGMGFGFPFDMHAGRGGGGMFARGRGGFGGPFGHHDLPLEFPEMFHGVHVHPFDFSGRSRGGFPRGVGGRGRGMGLGMAPGGPPAAVFEDPRIVMVGVGF